MSAELASFQGEVVAVAFPAFSFAHREYYLRSYGQITPLSEAAGQRYAQRIIRWAIKQDVYEKRRRHTAA